jgi:thioredoxin 1
MTGSFEKLINGEKPVLIDFTASWCGPCQMLAPVLEDVAEQMKENLTVIKIDVDKNPQLASSMGIKGVPTLILYQNGKQRWRSSGFMSAQALKNAVQNALA